MPHRSRRPLHTLIAIFSTALSIATLTACNGDDHVEPRPDTTANDEQQTPSATPTSSEPVAGGQSGGETSTGIGSAPAPKPPCACLEQRLQDNSTPVALRAKVLGLEGSCVLLEVVEELADIWGVEQGDVIGGQITELCAGPEPSEYLEGEEVLAVYQQRVPSYWECEEYRECTQTVCGLQLDERGAGIVEGEGDDACDGQCVEETQDACAITPAESQLGGDVQLAKLNGNNVTFFWAGEERSETIQHLAEPTCEAEHAALEEEYAEAVGTGAVLEVPVQDKPPGTASPTGPTAPPNTGATSPPYACPLPGWEDFFEAPDAGVP